MLVSQEYLRHRNLFSHSSGGQKSKPRFWQGWLLLEALRKNLPCRSQLQVVVGNPWYFLPCSCITLISASAFPWHSPVPVFKLPSCYKDTSYRISPTLIQQELILIMSAKTLLPNKFTFTGKGGQDFSVSLGQTRFNPQLNAERKQNPGLGMREQGQPTGQSPTEVLTAKVSVISKAKQCLRCLPERCNEQKMKSCK